MLTAPCCVWLHYAACLCWASVCWLIIMLRFCYGMCLNADCTSLCALMLSLIILTISMLSFKSWVSLCWLLLCFVQQCWLQYAVCTYANCHYAVYIYAECHYSECLHAQCFYAEFHKGPLSLTPFMLIAPRCVRLLMLSVSTYAEFQKGVLHYAEYCNFLALIKSLRWMSLCKMSTCWTSWHHL